MSWRYRTPVAVAETSAGWAVQAPATGSYWHPELKAGDALRATRTQGKRGDLLDANGEPLMPLGRVYPVQLDPARATAATASALEKLVGEPAGSLASKLAAAQKANSASPIPVITYRQADFDAKRTQLDALKGVIYPAREQPLARSRGFGQPLLGSYGPVSAEVVQKSQGRYAAGDYAGLSGLQGQYDSTLAGTAGVRVTSSGKPDRPLFEQAPTDGSDVKLTLDPAVQQAAEMALEGTGAVPSALVAIDVPTGNVLASANSPALGFDRAITGTTRPARHSRWPPRTPFCDRAQVTPQTTVDCPKTFTVDGRSYKNYEGESLGTPDFATDFAHSCNTAFIQLAAQLGDSDLATAAKQLGVGAGWAKTLGVNGAFDGSVPVNNGKTDQASASIGQGRDVVSPMALAVMAGSVARGSLIPPALVTDPAPAGSRRQPAPLGRQDCRRAAGPHAPGRGRRHGDRHGRHPRWPGARQDRDCRAWLEEPPPDPETTPGSSATRAMWRSLFSSKRAMSGGEVAAPVAKDFLTDLAANTLTQRNDAPPHPRRSPRRNTSGGGFGEDCLVGQSSIRSGERRQPAGPSDPG